MSDLGEAWDQANKTQQAIGELHAKLRAVEVAVHELVAAVESARKDGSVPSVVLYEASSKAVELGWELDALECDEDESADWDDDDDDHDDEDFRDSPLGWSDDDEDDWDDEDWDEFDLDEDEDDDYDDDYDDDDDDDDDGGPDDSAGPSSPLGNSGQSRIVNLCEGDVRKWGGLAS